MRRLALAALTALACGGKDAPAPERAGTADPSPVDETNAVPVAKPPVDAAVPDAAPVFESTGVPECDELIRKYLACEALPAATREAFVEGAESWREAIRQGGSETVEALARSCRAAQQATERALTDAGC